MTMHGIIKTEFAFNCEFASLKKWALLGLDYVNWYSNSCIRGSLARKTGVDFN